MLQLTSGQAEIFGTNLITGQALVLRGHKVAVRPVYTLMFKPKPYHPSTMDHHVWQNKA